MVVGDLQLGDEKLTLNHLVAFIFVSHAIFSSEIQVVHFYRKIDRSTTPLPPKKGT